MRGREGNAWLLAVALAAGSSSCASWSYRNATCHWFELAEIPELEVTGPRVTSGSEAPCTALNVPGHYVLHRVAYTVEFWNGERWYPQLFVRAFTPSSERLTLRSPQLFGAPNAQLRSDYSRTEAYDYFFRDRYTEEYVPMFERIEFTVLDASGRELGRESLKVVGKSGGKYRAYY